ncbi:MAG: HU family DNA-binding protein [bacterium]
MAKKTEKPVAKPVAKTAVKPTTKTVDKPAAKTATKPAAKPATKPTTKTVDKPAAKTAVKSTTKTVEKTSVKVKAKSMTKAQIITYMAEKLSLTKKQTGDFLNEFAELAYKEAKKDFVIPGLGKLSLVQRKKRTARNPKTGESIMVPAKKVVKFRVAKACKDAVLVKK